MSDATFKESHFMAHIKPYFPDNIFSSVVYPPLNCYKHAYGESSILLFQQ